MIALSAGVSESGYRYPSYTGDIAPTRPGVGVPIGNRAGDLTNKFGTKYTRGWLSGAGGADIENSLGACAFAVRPTPYNSRTQANWLAAGPQAPVPGLSNLDVDAPARTYGPLQQARAEFIPTTWTDQLAGLDVVSGNVGPRLATAHDGINGAPTPKYFAYGQVREGGDGWPSYAGGVAVRTGAQGAIANKMRAAVASRQVQQKA